MPLSGAWVTISTLSSVCLITICDQPSIIAGSAQRAFSSSMSSSNGWPENSSRWNRNSGAWAWAKAAWLVIEEAPVMCGFISPSQISPVLFSTRKSSSK